MELLAVVAFLVWSIAVGRVVLSLLPVGSIGGHGLRELPVTIAVSLFLGLATLATVWGLLPIRFDVYSLPALPVFIGISIAGALVCALRIALAPAAMVPRHEPASERSNAWLELVSATAVVLAFVGGAIKPVAAPSLWFVACTRFVRGHDVDIHLWTNPVLEGSIDAAMVVALGAALGVLRRTQGTRAFFMLLAALYPWTAGMLLFHFANGPETLACGVGALGAIAWLRRGDMRGLALCAFSFHALVWIDRKDWPIALAALTCLGLASPKASWRRVGVAVALGLLPLGWRPWGAWFGNEVRAPGPFTIAVGVGVTIAVAVALRTRLPDGRRERLGRESVWLTLTLFAAIAAMAQWCEIRPYADGRYEYPSLVDALVPCAVFVLLLLGGIGGAKQRDVEVR